MASVRFSPALRTALRRAGYDPDAEAVPQYSHSVFRAVIRVIGAHLAPRGHGGRAASPGGTRVHPGLWPEPGGTGLPGRPAGARSGSRPGAAPGRGADRNRRPPRRDGGPGNPPLAGADPQVAARAIRSSSAAAWRRCSSSPARRARGGAESSTPLESTRCSSPGRAELTGLALWSVVGLAGRDEEWVASRHGLRGRRRAAPYATLPMVRDARRSVALADGEVCVA